MFSSGARMFSLRKRHIYIYIYMLKFEKRGENGDSQKERGGGWRVPSTYPKG